MKLWILNFDESLKALKEVYKTKVTGRTITVLGAIDDLKNASLTYLYFDENGKFLNFERKKVPWTSPEVPE